MIYPGKISGRKGKQVEETETGKQTEPRRGVTSSKASGPFMLLSQGHSGPVFSLQRESFPAVISGYWPVIVLSLNFSGTNDVVAAGVLSMDLIIKQK